MIGGLFLFVVTFGYLFDVQVPDRVVVVFMAVYVPCYLAYWDRGWD